MEFFNNLTSASAGSMVMKPLIETGTAIAINRPTPRPKPRPTPIPTPRPKPRPKPRPTNPITPPIDEIIEENEQIDAYFGGGGGIGFPETTEVVEKKSNVGKTLLILTGLGLAFMLLAGGKKSKVK